MILTPKEAHDYFIHKKVYVGSVANSKLIQNILNDCGIKYEGSAETYIYPFIKIDEDTYRYYSLMTDFEEVKYKEISANDIIDIKIEEEFKVGDEVIIFFNGQHKSVIKEIVDYTPPLYVTDFGNFYAEEMTHICKKKQDN